MLDTMSTGFLSIEVRFSNGIPRGMEQWEWRPTPEQRGRVGSTNNKQNTMFIEEGKKVNVNIKSLVDQSEYQNSTLGGYRDLERSFRVWECWKQ